MQSGRQPNIFPVLRGSGKSMARISGGRGTLARDVTINLLGLKSRRAHRPVYDNAGKNEGGPKNTEAGSFGAGLAP